MGHARPCRFHLRAGENANDTEYLRVTAPGKMLGKKLPTKHLANVQAAATLDDDDGVSTTFYFTFMGLIERMLG